MTPTIKTPRATQDCAITAFRFYNRAHEALCFTTTVGSVHLSPGSTGPLPPSSSCCHLRSLYLVGTVIVTIVSNVPRNDALAAVDPASLEGARLWADYITSWTAWNHVRTAAALAAAASFTIALFLPRLSPSPS